MAFYNLKFDRAELLSVAQCVIALNEYADGHTPDTLADCMESFAWAYLNDGPNYGGTLGFYLSTYVHPMLPDTLGVKASIAAFIVEPKLGKLGG